MDASHVFPPSVLAIIPLIGCVVGVVVSRGCAGCEVGLPPHCVCHCLIGSRICSPVVGVEALRVGFDQTPLPLNVSPALKGVIVEENEAHVITKTLCVTCVGVHSSTQK